MINRNYIVCVFMILTAHLLYGEDVSAPKPIIEKVSLFKLIVQPEDYVSKQVSTAGVFAFRASVDGGMLYINQESRGARVELNAIFLSEIGAGDLAHQKLHGKYVNVSGKFVFVNGSYGIAVDGLEEVYRKPASFKTRSKARK